MVEVEKGESKMSLPKLPKTGFAKRFNQFDKQLRGDGVPVEEIGRQLLAPGITREKYIQTLQAIEHLETVDGRVRYKKRQPKNLKV